MTPTTTTPALDRLVTPLSDCFTPETAKRVLALKADSQLQARLDYLAGKSTEGTLTEEERIEYGGYVSFGTFVAILKSKARQLLADTHGE